MTNASERGKIKTNVNDELNNNTSTKQLQIIAKNSENFKNHKEAHLMNKLITIIMLSIKTEKNQFMIFNYVIVRQEI